MPIRRGGVLGKDCEPLPLARGSGGALQASQRGPGLSPSANRFFVQFLTSR